MSEAKRRQGHRLVAGEASKKLEELLKQPSFDKYAVQAQLNIIHEQREKIQRYNEIIQDSLDVDKLTKELQDCVAFITPIETCVLKAKDKIDASSTSRSASGNMFQSIVKLPILNLRKFSGNPLDWPQFWDSFDGSVNSRSDLKDAQKLSYLMGQLEGEAFMLVDGLTIIDEHYAEAINLLTSTFGKPNIIVQEHLHALMDLEISSSTAVALSRYRASYECHLRGIKSMKMNVDDAGYVYVAILMRKLPARIRENISRANLNNTWTLDSFRSAINTELELLSATEAPGDKELKQIEKKENTKLKATISNFSVTSNKNLSRTCQYCAGDHKTYECTKFTSVSDRTARVKELGLCFNCLKDNHSVSKCKSRTTCYKCKRRHHTTLCTSEVKKEETKAESSIVAIQTVKNRPSGIALPTAMMNIKNTKGVPKTVRAFFDQGAQESLILSSLANKLSLKKVKSIILQMDGFRSRGTRERYDVVNFSVQLRHKTQLVSALVVNELPTRINIRGISEVTSRLMKEDVLLADPDCGEVIDDVSVLIGADQYYEFVSSFLVYDDLHLINSSLGVMISGPISNQQNNILNSRVNLIKSLEETAESDDIAKLWELEVVGIREEEKDSLKENCEVLKSFLDSIIYEEGSYKVKLPWKKDKSFLRVNYGLSLGRLQSTLSKLRKNPHHLRAYDEIIKNYERQDFIENVTLKIDTHRDKVHFLPHHGVIRDSATTPLRIVFDCSAGSPSLNSLLHSGPCLLNDLTKIILRFRLGKYAILSDISKAFLRIKLFEEDQNVTMFMWPKYPDEKDSEIQYYAFKVVLFGATCSPFLLNATVTHHLKQRRCQTAKDIQRNIYVDNLQYTTDNEESLLKFYKESKTIMSEANLSLREWETNSPAVQNEINIKEDDDSSNLIVKILGLHWRKEDDYLFCKADLPVCDRNKFTKRTISSAASRVFDPIGILSPITINLKLLLQDTWSTKKKWDEVINDEKMYLRFSKCIGDLNLSLKIGIPRQVCKTRNVEIHAFSDASERAFGSILYIVENERSSFLMSKARLAPLKKTSIPKLELCAAIVSVRLVAFIQKTYSEELNIISVHYWSDSKVVLSWIGSKKQLTVYVKNRISEIRKHSVPEQWKYVNTKFNPADILSRGSSAAGFIASSLWFHGPEWLPKGDNWPENNNFNPEEFDIPFEEPVQRQILTISREAFVIDFKRFSNYNQLLRVTALILKFIKIARKKNNKGDCQTAAMNMAQAEGILLKQMQIEEFFTEYCHLKKPADKIPNLVSQLNLFLENDIIRCRGRIQDAELQRDEKFPILLSSTHYASKLIVRDAHKRVYHFGTSSVVEFLRRRFWMPRMRQIVKTEIRSCVTCNKMQSRNFSAPPQPPLPEQRIQQAKPFQTTGIDYTGSLLVKQENVTSKVYIVLFTCTVTRAIHLEIAPDNSRDSFLLALRRFIGRRSCPQLIISDNAKTFTSSAKFLRALQEDTKIEEELAQRGIAWKFIPPRSPWYGGFWERLIGITKSAIKKVLGNSLLTLEELQTVVVEVEGSLNDRPISFVSDDLQDLNAITPSMLLYGFKLGNLADPKINEDPTFGEKSLLTARMKFNIKVKQQLWLRWKKEYLLALRERSQKPSRRGSRIIKLGDVVIIHEDIVPRLHWKMGVVIELVSSSDGHVRSVKLRTTSGIMVRPILKLYPLEIQSNDAEKAVSSGSSSPEVKIRRSAAIKAEKKIKSTEF